MSDLECVCIRAYIYMNINALDRNDKMLLKCTDCNRITKEEEVLHFGEARKYWLNACTQEIIPGITNQYLHHQQRELAFILLNRVSRINLGGKWKWIKSKPRD